MPELLDISLQLNSCREVVRSHGTMAGGGGSLKSCERGEGLGGVAGAWGGQCSAQHLVGIQMCCHFTREP